MPTMVTVTFNIDINISYYYYEIRIFVIFSEDVQQISNVNNTRWISLVLEEWTTDR